MSEAESTKRAYTFRFEPPDLVILSIVGVLDEAEATALTRELSRHVRHLPRYFARADFSRSESITAEGRRAAAKEVQGLRLQAGAIIGASFHFRALTMLVVTASRVLSRRPLPTIRFFDTEDEADRWLLEQRALAPSEADRSRE